jgi:hypothetical protein
MTATTELGTWATHGTGGGNATLEDSVEDFLGEFVDDYDLEGLVRAYRDAINAALPQGVSLHGEVFYGPWGADLDAEAVASVDLAALAQQFDTTA